MCIDIKRMISDRLDDLFVVIEFGEDPFEHISFIEQSDKSEGIITFEYFIEFLFDAFFGDLTDEIRVFLERISSLFREITFQCDRKSQRTNESERIFLQSFVCQSYASNFFVE